MFNTFETRRAGSGLLLRQSTRDAIKRLETLQQSYDESEEAERQLADAESKLARCVLRLHGWGWTPGAPPVALRAGNATFVAVSDEFDLNPRLLIATEVSL